MRSLDIARILKNINPNVVLLEDLDEALIGYTNNIIPNIPVYDTERILCLLSKKGMKIDEYILYLEEVLMKKSNILFVSL